MPPTKEGGSKFSLLHERGVILEDEVIEYILQTVDRGIEMAKRFLDQSDHRTRIIFTNNFDWIGYSCKQLAINIPIPYLNMIAKLAIPLEKLPFAEQGVSCDGFNLKINYEKYLIAAGIEEIIHHFQYIGHPVIFAEHPHPEDESYNNLPMIDRLLSQHEVEARKLTDLILQDNDLEPIWTPLDEHLKRNYPDRYGKPYQSGW